MPMNRTRTLTKRASGYLPIFRRCGSKTEGKLQIMQAIWLGNVEKQDSSDSPRRLNWQISMR
jgi:hypothetical protein